MAKISFVGLTHLGLVTSICWSSLKQNVNAIDSSEKKVNRLKKGEVPEFENGLDVLLKDTKKYYHPTTDFSLLKDSDLVFITLDTPTDNPDNLDELNALIEKSLPHLKQSASIAILSQVPVGFTRKLYSRIKEGFPSLNLDLYYWVNTLVIGDSVKRFLKPERIIIGTLDSKDVSTSLGTALENFVCPIVYMSYESAEMTKSAINLFLASSITTANELSEICESVGADYSQITEGLKTDRRIGQFAYLQPTLRISGGHLERELSRLKDLGNKHNIKTSLIDEIIRSNETRYQWVIHKVNSLLKKERPHICIWGLSYKKGTASVDNAVSQFVISELSKKAAINVYDPMANSFKGNYKRFEDKYEALKETDCLITLTDWDEFKEADPDKISSLMSSPLIIDCAGILPGNLRKIKGYFAMGKG